MLAKFPEPCPPSKFEIEPEDDQSSRTEEIRVSSANIVFLS